MRPPLDVPRSRRGRARRARARAALGIGRGAERGRGTCRTAGAARHGARRAGAVTVRQPARVLRRVARRLADGWVGDPTRSAPDAVRGDHPRCRRAATSRARRRHHERADSGRVGRSRGDDRERRRGAERGRRGCRRSASACAARRRGAHPVHVGLHRRSEGRRAHAPVAARALDRFATSPRRRVLPSNPVPAPHALRSRSHLQLPVPVAVGLRPVRDAALPARSPDATREPRRRAPDHVSLLRALHVARRLEARPPAARRDAVAGPLRIGAAVGRYLAGHPQVERHDGGLEHLRHHGDGKLGRGQRRPGRRARGRAHRGAVGGRHQGAPHARDRRPALSGSARAPPANRASSGSTRRR